MNKSSPPDVDLVIGLCYNLFKLIRNRYMKGVVIINSEMILIDSIKELELSVTQYMRIKSSYDALSEELKKNDTEVEVYTQGSILLGTTIRPYRKNKNVEYDVDLVAQYPKDKSTLLPQQVRDYVGNTFKQNGTYASKLLEKKRCWRIEYAEQEGLGFHADIVPAIPESQIEIQKILTKPGFEYLADLSVAITHKDDDDSRAEWLSCNPKGYGEWFSLIKSEKYRTMIEQKRSTIYMENKDLFSNIDEVPIQLVKTPMQRVIQLLKRHRDVYFSGKKSEDDKPISIIITTLAAEIVDTLNLQQLGFVDLLAEVTRALIEVERLIDNKLYTSYQIRSLIYRKESEWWIPNPVNINENFADKWNDNINIPRAFFDWLKALERDIIDNINDKNFHKILCEKLAVPCKDSSENEESIISVSSNTSSKPWSRHGK